MPVPTLISELSTTPGSNSPSGSDSPSVLDDHQRTAYAFIKTLSDAQVSLTGNQTIAGTKTFSSPIAGSVTGSAASVSGTVAIANGGTGQTTAAAAFTAIKQDASEAATGVVERLTTAEARAGIDPTRYHSAATMKAAQIQNATAVTLTTQTAVDFTGIPSWAKKITIYFVGVSTNGTGSLLVQIGDSGGVEVTGYLGSGSTIGDGISPVNSLYTTGFGIRQIAAGQVGHGAMTLHLVDGTAWVAYAVLSRSDVGSVLVSSGSKSLSATLDRVRITTINGTDQFDAGTVNISYE